MAVVEPRNECCCIGSIFCAQRVCDFDICRFVEEHNRFDLKVYVTMEFQVSLDVAKYCCSLRRCGIRESSAVS